MASPTGDGSAQPEGTSPAASPAAGDGADVAAGQAPDGAAARAAPADTAPGAGSPVAPASDAPAPPSVPVLPPPVAVPTVRARPERPVNGITTASDYVAPRELPAHTPGPSETAAAKVVIHVPDAAANVDAPAAPSEAEVAELRQRRRAPTMKIDRSAVKELKVLDDARAAASAARIIDSGPPPRHTPAPRQTPAPLVTDAPRALARPAPERPTPRRAGWIIALVATALVGGGALAVGLGWVPGLAPVEPAPPSVGQAEPEPNDDPAPAASPVTTAAPSASASSDAPVEDAAAPSASAPASASAPSAAASVPESPASASASGSAPVPPPRVAPWRPRPRPKSDIPTGI